MARAPRIMTQAAQAYSFSRRAWLLGAAQAGVGGLLIGRMGWLAIAENEHYNLLSESNRVSLTMIPPRRGWIVDRHGQPIANNRADFRVDVIPDRLEDKDRTLALLRQILALTDEDMARIEAIFVMPHEPFSYTSSSLVKQVAKYGGDVTQFVPAGVAAELKRAVAT